jgi:hypothetical protein
LRQPLIHVPRDLVRRSAAVLSKLPGWKRHQCRSLKELIYGLNSIFDGHWLLKYRHGFPQPSVTVRELERLHRLCQRSSKVRNIAARIEVLIKRDTDSYGLLLFQAALTWRYPGKGAGLMGEHIRVSHRG